MVPRKLVSDARRSSATSDGSTASPSRTIATHRSRDISSVNGILWYVSVPQTSALYTEWVPKVTVAGMAIISRDRVISRRRAEEDAILAAGAQMFAITDPGSFTCGTCWKSSCTGGGTWNGCGSAPARTSSP